MENTLQAKLPPQTASTDKYHPATKSSAYCLVIYTLITLVGFILEHQKAGLGGITCLMGTPFIVGSMFCAIYAMCHGQIRYGVLLLAGLSLMLAVAFGSLIMSGMHTALSGAGGMQLQSQEFQKQLEQMLNQLSQ